MKHCFIDCVFVKSSRKKPSSHLRTRESVRQPYSIELNDPVTLDKDINLLNIYIQSVFAEYAFIIILQISEPRNHFIYLSSLLDWHQTIYPVPIWNDGGDSLMKLRKCRICTTASLAKHTANSWNLFKKDLAVRYLSMLECLIYLSMLECLIYLSMLSLCVSL